jgi:pimeloyl-ACP methyl ester carboxylesterase
MTETTISESNILTGFITYKGKNIRYKSGGNGHPIVLLHGFLETLDMWKYHARKLSQNYNVITIDLPGFGGSQCIGQVHLMEEMAMVVNKVLQQLDISKCLMIGHSMGGYVTLSFAKRFPGKLKGFGLFHSHALADTPEAKQNRERAVEIVRSDRGLFIINFFPELFAPENVKKFSKEIHQMHLEAMETTPEAIIASLEGMKHRTNNLEILINARVPVLFILGKKDSRVPFEKTLAQASLPAVSEIHILGEAGHMGHIEARKKTLQAIEGFAGKVF